MSEKPSVFAELKRRNVYKVAVAYAIVGWLSIQIATQVFPFLEIPNWVVRLVILAVAIGFPIALVIAWAFELTPEGLKRTEDVDASGERVPKKRAWIYIVVIGAAISVALFFVGRYSASSTATSRQDAAPARAEAGTVSTIPQKSIAVLPFDNLSEEKGNAYFAEGIQDEILTRLAKVADLKVISRTSVMPYRGKQQSVREIGKALGVSAILEGSVRKSASRVRVTGQLIDATLGNHLWAERYDRELSDIFELQDEITTRVIGSVSPQILLAEAARVRRKPPQSIHAWDLVMQALPHMWRMTTEDHRRAQDLLLEALTLDPDYAHPYALLGWIYITMFNLDTGKPIHEFTERALDAGTRAVELDDQDPWGHLVLGLGYARRRKPEAALTHLSKAVELNPSFALGHAGLGYGLAVGGQPERGLEALEQAHRLSPRDPFLAIYAPTVRYMALFALARYEETIAVCRETATVHPNHAGAWRLMTVSLALLGREEEAKDALARTLALQPDLSMDHVEQNTVYADPADRSRFLEGLRKAGLQN
jgi:TolB-like protein